MPELLDERTISTKAFAGAYALAAAAGVVVGVACFVIPGAALFSPLALLPVAGVFLRSWLSRSSARYRLFSDRLELETGILGRKIENIDLFRVRDVGLRQGLVGRLADFGDVYIHSTDSSTPDVHLRGIDRPREFYDQLRSLVGQTRAQMRTMIVEEGRAMPEP